MKNRKNFKIVFIFFISVALIVTLIPFQNSVTATSSQTLTIYSDGKVVDEILLDEDKNQIFKAVGLTDFAKYQWQILMPNTNDTWINIYNMTSDTCKISYALLENLLNRTGKTAIRCIATLDDEEYTSQSVYITMQFHSIETISNEASQTTNINKIKSSSASFYSLTDNNVDEEYVTITIYYKLEQLGHEENIFSPYVAKLHKGSSFSATVPSPTFEGYVPTFFQTGDYEDQEADASNVELNYTYLQENQEITIWYRPAYVSYIARYFLQNISNDSYTEDTNLMINGKALTGDYPSEDIDKKIDGFTALYHEPDTVASDGSTEFYCYYDRNFYLYNFDCNGGYGVDPVYARYGTTLLVNNPTRKGYEFEGWDKMEKDGSYDGIADVLPTSIGIGNETFKAIWKSSTTNFNVIYWLENANDDSYSYLTSVEYETTSGMNLRQEDLDNFKLSSRLGDTYENSNIEIPYYIDANYVEYSAEKTKINNDFNEIANDGSPCISVRGDGSTTVNVVFTRKVYTLKFFYAKSEGTGNNIKYYVVGGSTYYFGKCNTDDEQKMLEAENNEKEVWGEVTELPRLNANGKSKGYKTGSETYNDVTYYYLSFEAKYGADISRLWPVSIFESVTRKTANTHGNWTGMEAYRSAWNGEYYVKYTQDNLNGNQTIKGIYQKLDATILYDLSKHTDSNTVRYLCFWENGADVSWSVPKLFIYEYYIPLLENETEENKTIVTYNGKKYKLYIGPINTYDDSTVDQQTHSTLDGYTYLGLISKQNDSVTDENGNSMSSYTVQFFYERNNYRLEFYNYNDTFFSENVPYETSLSQYYTDNIKIPKYPDGLELGAYEFDGWYWAPEGQGARIDFDTSSYIMPSSNLTVYAYWKLISKTVTFSDTYDDMLNKKYKQTFTINHGDYLTNVPNPDSSSLGNENYIFQGWFYIDEMTGEKKAFDTNSMPITDNIDLFAEWRSSSIVKYTIHYVYKQDNEIHVSSDTIGYSYAGMTKTFTAKAGEELDANYQKGYYPTVNSHSILMSETSYENEYTFTYEYKENVKYTVKYLDKSTGKELKTAKIASTNETVTTEKFEVISGYVPDAYYKRLVLSTNDEQNVLIFYYTKDEQHAIYIVKHMIEELDGSYLEYASIEGIGNIDEELPIQSPLSIVGFSYNIDETKNHNVENGITILDNGVKGKVKTDGLEMYIYYTRNTYNYMINYYEYGTTFKLQDSKTDSAKYGSTIAIENTDNQLPEKIEKEGVTYYLIGDLARSIFIRENETYNQINIYYQAKNSYIHYIAVSKYPGASEFGTITPSFETVKSSSQITGSMAEAKEGYQFVGWYKDAACTILVDSSWVSDTEIKPQLTQDDTVYYYALFEPITADLTIEKSGVNQEDCQQNFLFHIKGTSSAGSSIDKMVSITGNGSVTIKDLPIGNYIIEENTLWSWRYGMETNSSSYQEKTISNENENKVIFHNLRNNKDWLGGESSKDNVYKFE